jgi:hypothetical protein
MTKLFSINDQGFFLDVSRFFIHETKETQGEGPGLENLTGSGFYFRCCVTGALLGARDTPATEAYEKLYPMSSMLRYPFLLVAQEVVARLDLF